MHPHASSISSTVQPSGTLAALVAALTPHDGKVLVLARAEGRQVRAGYHVTEVKAGSFVTLDCGGTPDAWQETLLQVEDIPAPAGGQRMTVGKFLSILSAVDSAVGLHAESRLTLEIGRPDEAMRVYDLAGIELDGGRAILRLAARPAICKPRHRSAGADGGCRASVSKPSGRSGGRARHPAGPTCRGDRPVL